MNQVPHITLIQSHFEDSNLELDLTKDADGHYINEVARYAWMNWMTAYSFGREHQANIAKKAIEITLAEQATEQPLITADEARKLGAGWAEYCFQLGDMSWTNWHPCLADHKYINSLEYTYRAIKQPEPVEQATVLRSDFDFVKQDKQRCVKLIEEVYPLLADDKSMEAKELLQKRVNNMNVNIPVFIEPVNPHAELKEMYEQQVKDGTLDDFVWLVREGKNWTHRDKINNFYEHLEYSCTPKPTCQIRNLDTGELKAMTRDKAKLLQAETKDACDWFNIAGGKSDNFNYRFDGDGIYTYKLKVKPLKQVSWSSVPVGVAVQTVNHKFICTFVGMTANGLISIYNKTAGADNYRAAKFELAPASEQDFIAVQRGQTGYGVAQVLRSKGFEVEMHESGQKYRITGLAEGYELK